MVSHDGMTRHYILYSGLLFFPSFKQQKYATLLLYVPRAYNFYDRLSVTCAIIIYYSIRSSQQWNRKCSNFLFEFFLFLFLKKKFARSSECDVVRGECTQTYVPYLFLVIPLGPVTLTGQDYVLVESGCVCKPKYAGDAASEAKVTP